jgi:MFS family permease
MVSLALGMIIGPLLSAFLYDLTHDYNIAIFISSGTLFFLMLYATILPESLPKHARVAKVTRSVVDRPATASPAERVLATMKSGLVTMLEPVLLFLPGRIETAPGVNVSPSPYTLLILLASYGLCQFASNGKK